ncbi:hypothetical protein ACQCVK_02845 [Rossellomorea vietnamensis]|uniref:hypothetical protein n=1 Tax=Rossellomorea vietnamensis TaxID=218284 RepID=UPI003CF72339
MSEMAVTYGIPVKSLPFYKIRINRFFNDYMGIPINQNKPFNAITYFDVDTFLIGLESSEAEKLNHYYALKRFFEYTYLKGKTKEIISQVTKPKYNKKPKQTLSKDEYDKLKNFIVSKHHNNIGERLIVGLFLFTGLSRKYLASLTNNQLFYDGGIYNLVVWKNEEEIKLPLKAELQLLVHEYLTSVNDGNLLEKVIPKNENDVSTYIGDITHSVLGKRVTPTILSNTFISLALSTGNNIWEVSKLTLESVITIEQHITEVGNLINVQTSILNSF